MTVSEAFSYKTHLLIATVLPQIRSSSRRWQYLQRPPPLEMLGYGIGLSKTKVTRRLQAFSYGVIRPYRIAKVRSGGTRPQASSSSSSRSYSSAPLRTRGSWEWEALARVGEVVWILCVAHCFVEYVAEPYTVAGPSMEPTIRHMSVVAINKMHRRSAPLKVGEIVVAQAPPEPGRMVLKRVLGVAGDCIKVCPPPWDVKNTLDIEKRLEVVPEGHVWLEGDNKDNSTDSRSYGAVPQALVEGVVFVRLWPLRDAGLM